MIAPAHLTLHNMDMERDRSIKVRGRQLCNTSIISPCEHVPLRSSKLLSMCVVNWASCSTKTPSVYTVSVTSGRHDSHGALVRNLLLLVRLGLILG